MKSRVSGFHFLVMGCAAGGLLLAGCGPVRDMKDEGRLKPYEGSAFFEDGRSARIPPDGTIARGQLKDDDHYYKGKVGGEFVKDFPFEVTPVVLQRGRERYDIFCSVCHDRTGFGEGMVVQRGFKKPPSLHEARLGDAAQGYFFDVISNGFGEMSGYAAQIPTRDRWAIVAYIRALQLSQHASVGDVPRQNVKDLDSTEQKPKQANQPSAHHDESK